MIASEIFDSLKFNVELSDQTGSIVATVFPQDAEGMFGITTEYMKENIKQVTCITNVAENPNIFVSIIAKL